MKRLIPNALTLINLLAGSIAVIAVLQGAYLLVALLLALCLLADYLDGFFARLLKVQSALGGQLDSLADMVSFGLLPGLIAYSLIDEIPGMQAAGVFNLYGLPALLIPVLSAIRLGRFNLDESQQNGFKGLATPANTIFFMGLMLVSYRDSFHLREWVLNSYFLYACILLFSYLLVAPLPMFNLKFKNLSWKENLSRILFLMTSFLMLVLVKEAAFSAIIFIYILFSVIESLLHTRTSRLA